MTVIHASIWYVTPLSPPLSPPSFCLATEVLITRWWEPAGIGLQLLLGFNVTPQGQPSGERKSIRRKRKSRRVTQKDVGRMRSRKDGRRVRTSTRGGFGLIMLGEMWPLQGLSCRTPRSEEVNTGEKTLGRWNVTISRPWRLWLVVGQVKKESPSPHRSFCGINFYLIWPRQLLP